MSNQHQAVEPQQFRTWTPMEKPPASVAELGTFLSHNFDDGTNRWRPGYTPDPHLPRVTRVDSVRVLTSAEGLDDDLAEHVDRLLASEHWSAVVLVEGMALPAEAGV